MRLLFVVALALAAFLAAADVSALNDSPSKRLLRSTVSVDEEEERGMWETLSNKVSKLIKPNQFAIKTMDDPKIAKVAGTSLLENLKSVNPKKFDSVDDLFRGKAFNNLENYILRLNNQDMNKQTSVAKVFSTGLGDKQAFQIFYTATQSSDEAVMKSGRFFRDQLLNQWATEGKMWAEVSKSIPKGLPANYYPRLEKKYFDILFNLAYDTQKRAARLARLEKARAAANTAA